MAGSLAAGTAAVPSEPWLDILHEGGARQIELLF